MAEEVAHFGSWEWDVTKPRAIWSEEMFRIFGLKPQAGGLTLAEFRSFIHPDDLAEVTKKMANVFISAKLNQKGELDYRIIRRDGSVRIIHSQRQVKALTEDGKLKAVVGVDQDVTEQRLAEQVSAENIKLLALAEEVAHFGSWEYHVIEDRALWSPELFRIFGIKPSFQGLTMNEYRRSIHPDDLPLANKLMLSFQKTAHLGDNVIIDYRIIRPDGSIRTIHSQRQVKEITPDGKPKVIVGVEQDVTEQKLAEQVSAEIIKLLGLAEEVAHFGSWELNISEPRAKWSPGMFRAFGIEPNPLGVTWEDYTSFIHPDDRDAAMKNAQTMLNSPLNHRETFDYRIIRPDGSVRILNAQRQVREVDARGKAKNVVGVDQDVTEQRKAEAALKKSEERFRIVAEAANVMVYEIELPTEKIHYVRGLEQLAGYSPQEAGDTLDWAQNHMHPDDVEYVRSTWNQARDDPDIDRYVIEYRIRHKKGHYIIVKDTAKAVKDATGRTLRFIGGMRNITRRVQDRKKIEQYSRHLEDLVAKRTKQLIEYERLAAIGQMAGMVGHDIRNPLQALTGEVYLIKTELDNQPQNKHEIIDCLDSIEQNLFYIDKIVADLQDYSRKLHPEYQEVDLENLIAEVFDAIVVPSQIQLCFKIKPLPKTNLDPTFIRRALTNLINNAIQAMPNGGKLEIACYPQNDNAYLTVTDTGVGIPKKLKNKLFTPLFTTKSKGQGLGLAVVKRLIEAQGGTISFRSAVGKGTTFIITLPLQRK
jgi:PAS domain S-box-containing protein